MIEPFFFMLIPLLSSRSGTSRSFHISPEYNKLLQDHYSTDSSRLWQRSNSVTSAQLDPLPPQPTKGEILKVVYESTMKQDSIPTQDEMIAAIYEWIMKQKE